MGVWIIDKPHGWKYSLCPEGGFHEEFVFIGLNERSEGDISVVLGEPKSKLGSGEFAIESIIFLRSYWGSLGEAQEWMRDRQIMYISKKQMDVKIHEVHSWRKVKVDSVLVGFIVVCLRNTPKEITLAQVLEREDLLES